MIVQKSLKKNAVLNIFKSAMAVIFPLITFPYVSNVLGVTSLGRYNFANSVISYYLMMAALGISSYAIREGAALREDRSKFSRFASEVFTINIISSIVSYILLAGSILFLPKFQEYYDCILILSLEIMFTTIGVEWVYTIYEEYTYITVRRISFQLLSLILMFIFVKDTGDVITYCGIAVIANAGANILNVVNVRKHCNIKVTLNINWKRHLKPIFIIFASTLAIKLYTSSDTVMLGFFSGDYSVGLYSVAVKVYNVLKPLLMAVTVVAIPRLAAYVGSGNTDAYRSTLNKIFSILFVLVLPAVVGLCMLSDNVILLLSNSDFLSANLSLKLLSVAIIFSIYSSFYNQCVLIPNKMEKNFLIATIVSAVINIGANVVLIPRFGHNGAAFTTVIAEFVSMFMCYWAARKKVKIEKIMHTVISSAIGCLGIIIICCLMKYYIQHNVLCITVSVSCSVIWYGFILIATKNNVAIYGIRIIREKMKAIRTHKSLQSGDDDTHS